MHVPATRFLKDTIHCTCLHWQYIYTQSFLWFSVEVQWHFFIHSQGITLLNNDVASFVQLLSYDVETLQVPGLLKIRHIGQTTLGSAAVFSLFLAAGTLIQSHQFVYLDCAVMVTSFLSILASKNCHVTSHYVIFWVLTLYKVLFNKKTENYDK